MEVLKLFELENQKYLYEDKYASEEEWLSEVCPSVLEAYIEQHTYDQEYQENY